MYNKIKWNKIKYRKSYGIRVEQSSVESVCEELVNGVPIKVRRLFESFLYSYHHFTEQKGKMWTYIPIFVFRQDIKHFFECFCEVVGTKESENTAWIIQKFPESYKDENVLKSVPQFAFPCEFDR